MDSTLLKKMVRFYFLEWTLLGANDSYWDPSLSYSQIGTPHKRAKSGVKFKCGFVLEGSNVFRGLQALVNEGIALSPLPKYVHDAPMMGKNIIIAKNANICDFE